MKCQPPGRDSRGLGAWRRRLCPVSRRAISEVLHRKELFWREPRQGEARAQDGARGEDGLAEAEWPEELCPMHRGHTPRPGSPPPLGRAQPRSTRCPRERGPAYGLSWMGLTYHCKGLNVDLNFLSKQGLRRLHENMVYPQKAVGHMLRNIITR